MAVALAVTHANYQHLALAENHVNTSSLNFYKPGALSDAKHSAKAQNAVLVC